MNIARSEMVIVNAEDNINGLMFAPDFDTSQVMDMVDIISKIIKGKYKAVSKNFRFKGVDVPALIVGNGADMSDEKFNDVIKRYSYLLKGEYEKNLDIETVKSNNFKKAFMEIELGGMYYLIQEEKQFFCFTDFDLIMFIANPFPCILEEREALQNKKYRKNKCVRLKGHLQIVDVYKKNIKKRQAEYRNYMTNLFNNFSAPDAESKIVVGTVKRFFNEGYTLLLGTKKDHETCFSKRTFPYTIEEDKFFRLTDEQVENLIKEGIERQKKVSIACQRIDALATLLRQNNLTYTVISRNDIHFNDDGTWKAWMNAQVYDDAASGWFTEQDFIDWLNCTGQIPYKRGNVKRTALMLEKMSDGEYKFEGIMPADKKTYTQYDDYDAVAEFKHNGDKFKMDIESMQMEIKKYGKIKTYTSADIEALLPKESLKDIIKRVFKRETVCV